MWAKKPVLGFFQLLTMWMESDYSTMIVLLLKNAKTCPYKGKKAFFLDFTTFDHVGYGKWQFYDDFALELFLIGDSV